MKGVHLEGDGEGDLRPNLTPYEAICGFLFPGRRHISARLHSTVLMSFGRFAVANADVEFAYLAQIPL